MNTWLTFQYTLTETHLGGAGADGATDLPIVREANTDLPFLPDTALKGVARHLAGEGPTTDSLFGSHKGVGKLTFTQGHLLLYPLRSLQRPYVYATSPLLLARLDRMLRAFFKDRPPLVVPKELLSDSRRARVTRDALHAKDLVVEGVAFGAADVELSLEAQRFAKALAALFPMGEEGTARRVELDLVVLPDADLVHLLRTAPPVRARIALDDNTKTTSGEGGNLWYEEMLPSDCLFWSVMSLRDARLADPVATLFGQLAQCQIGAGESTGHGRCWWWAAGGST
jgi:CRISPR-associated protein Cmr4